MRSRSNTSEGGDLEDKRDDRSDEEKREDGEMTEEKDEGKEEKEAASRSRSRSKYIAKSATSSPSRSKSRSRERKKRSWSRSRRSNSRKRSISRRRSNSRKRSGSRRRRSSSRRRRRSRTRSRSPKQWRSQENDEDGFRLHVADLTEECRKKDLERIFMKFGPLKEIWLASYAPYYAFIVFRNRDDAQDACKRSDGEFIAGRRIRVSPAKPRHVGPRNRFIADRWKGGDDRRDRDRSYDRYDRRSPRY